jgi:hypothetical protein
VSITTAACLAVRLCGCIDRLPVISFGAKMSEDSVRSVSKRDLKWLQPYVRDGI